MSGNGHTTKTRSPYCEIAEVPTGAVVWTEGFWAERFSLCHHTVLPGMREALHDPDNRASLTYLSIAAGEAEGQHHGTNWSDGDCAKWMEALAHVYAVTGDGKIEKELDGWVETIEKAQEADGYLSTQVQLTDKGRWEKLQHHELYNMGHVITAACVHYHATGKNRFLSVATKLADYLCGVFVPPPQELAHFGFNPSQIMALVDLYRTTGEPRYLELARVFVDMRGSRPGGTDQNQDRVALREETEAVGHAVTATYLYCGVADVYAETGDRALLDALERIWKDVTTRKMYITGGVGTLHQGVSLRRDPVHESFAMEYKLPSSTAYTETCSNIGNAMWNWRMLKISGDAKYADVMEQVVYNTGLSGMSLDGLSFCYTNPLRWYGNDHRLLSQDAHSRWKAAHCYCCPPQVARTIARMHEWVYGLSDRGVWVHLYGGNRLDTSVGGERLLLAQETEYPRDGEVSLTFERAPEAVVDLRLRIPGWVEDAEIRINGESAGASLAPGTYATISRVWSPGDRVEISLPMPVRLVEAHPRAEAVRNQVAVMRGPIVYCLESIDLREGMDLAEVHVSRDTVLTPLHEPDLLGGVTTLEGEAVRVVSGGWEGKLYRPVKEKKERGRTRQVDPVLRLEQPGYDRDVRVAACLLSS